MSGARKNALSRRNKPGNGNEEAEHRVLELVAVELVGAAEANVAGVDEVLHLQGDEVMMREPDQIGSGEDGCREDAAPEPAAAQVMALRR